MDKKKKDQEANDTHDFLSNEDQNQVDVEKNTTIGSSSHDNIAFQNQQPQPVFQWPYTSQTGVEQTHLIPKPCIANQSPSPAILSQWHQSQHQQQSFTIHPVQHNQPSAHFAQPTIPFWQPHQACFHLPGPNPNVPPPYQPLPPEGMAELTWRGPGTSSGGISTSQQRTPSFCYHVGYTYPGFPGPLESSTWWNQPQYFLPHCNSASPGPCNALSSVQPPVPGCSAGSAPSAPRGIIRPPQKLSVKHQQLWEAQSAENIQLWNAIGQLQSELADYKSRLTKLEADVLTVKPIVEEVADHGNGASPAGQALKRRRAKRSLAANEVLPSPDVSRTRGRGRKLAINSAQCESRVPRFEKVILNKVDGKISFHQTNEDKIEPTSTRCNGNIVIPGSNDLFQSQIEQDGHGFQITEACLNRSESKHDDDKFEGSTVFSVSSQNAKGIGIKNSPADYGGMPTNTNFFWPSSIASGDCERDMINITAQGLYNATSIPRKERKFVAEWSFGNEDDHPAGFEHVAAEPTKDEDEEMENDGNSSAEDIA